MLGNTAVYSPFLPFSSTKHMHIAHTQSLFSYLYRKIFKAPLMFNALQWNYEYIIRCINRALNNDVLKFAASLSLLYYYLLGLNVDILSVFPSWLAIVLPNTKELWNSHTKSARKEWWKSAK